VLLALILLCAAATAFCAERSVYLGVCQELVNSARAYEARANYHNQVAKNIMLQIDSCSKLPKNSGTMQTIDNLFSRYEETRALENKLRALQREAARQADTCMKSAE
jgi:hypothetical protein